MGKCRTAVNRILMLRKRNLTGPMYQNIGFTCAHTMGFAYDANGPLAAGGATLAFHALTPDPTTGEMLGVKTGTGDLTTTHTSTIYAQDHEGVYQAFPANAPVWEGARCVLTGAAGTAVDTAYGTDSGGDPLTELPWLKYQPAATNSLMYSNDLTNAAWTPGALAVSFDQVGITGAPNTASLLTDDDASAAEVVYSQGASSQPTGATIVHKFWIKKLASDPSNTVRIRQALVGGTSANFENYFNAYSGTVVTAGSPATEVIDDGDWWILMLQCTDTTNDNTLHRIFIWPTGGNAAGVGDNSQTGSITIGNVELHTNKTIAQVRGLGPIFTTSAAASTDTTNHSFDSVNLPDTDCALYCEVSGQRNVGEWGSAMDIAIISKHAALGNAALGMDRNTGFRVSDETSAASVGYNTDLRSAVKASIVYHADDALMTVNKDGSYSVSGDVAYDGTLRNDGSGKLYLLNAGSGDAYKMRNLQRYDIPDYQTGKDKIDELMGA